MKHAIIGLTLGLIMALSGAAVATDYFDGGIHIINGPSAGVGVGDSTTLYVTDGGSINAAPGVAGINAYDDQIYITGGSITGGSVPSGDLGGAGVAMQGGVLNISGGTITGGSADFAPASAVITYYTQVVISGGRFHGGDSQFPGEAVVVNGGSIQISGGSFFGGNGSSGGAALALAAGNGTPPPAYALITGGTFIGGNDGTGVSYGDFRPFAVLIGGNAPSSMDLKGGQFLGDFYMEEGSVLNVYGHGLTLTDNRHLAGTLLDGSPLAVDVFIKATSVVNLINVPEPTTLAQSLTAVLVLPLVLRRRSRTDRWAPLSNP